MTFRNTGRQEIDVESAEKLNVKIAVNYIVWKLAYTYKGKLRKKSKIILKLKKKILFFGLGNFWRRKSQYIGKKCRKMVYLEKYKRYQVEAGLDEFPIPKNPRVQNSSPIGATF